MSKASIIATTVLVAAVAILAVTTRGASRRRLEQLEQRIAILEQEATARAGGTAGHVVVTTGSRTGTDPTAPVEERAEEIIAHLQNVTASNQKVMARLQHVEDSVALSDKAVAETIEEYVADVIEGRVTELETKQRTKQNKEPTFHEFASVLELTEEQEQVVHDEVWELQDKVRELLDIPTADGTTLLEDLEEIAALKEVGHPQTGWRFMQWYWRVVSEPIPGTEVTYGSRIEGMRNETQDQFREVFGEEQYAEFESWQLDPTRIKDLEDSPWSGFEERVQERVAALSAPGSTIE